MPGTKAGSLKAKQTILAKYGANFYSEAGRIGGKAKTATKGFGHPDRRELASKYGKIGGEISTRTIQA